MTSENKIFDLRDEVDIAVHTMKPSWWMRYGILSAFLILLIIMALGYIVQYPDRVYGEFRLLSSQPAITIPLTQDAQIDKVFKKDGSVLNKGDHILLLANSANYNDLVRFEALLKPELSADEEFVAMFENLRTATFHLGDLQGLLTQLYSKLFEHYSIVSLLKYDKKVKRLERQLAKQYQLDKKLRALLLMNATEKNILKEFFLVDSVLAAAGVISKVNYLVKEEEYLNKKKGQQQHEITWKRNELEILGLVNAIEEAKEEKRENLIALHLQITETITKLKSEIENWKKQFLVVAPIHGTLNYLGSIGEKKFVDNKEHTVVITPPAENFKAIIKIPFLRSGKVEKGQIVHFKLNDYPHHEYGYLEGELFSISNVAGLDNYFGEVRFGRELKTNYKKTIHIKENMSGIAEIVTDDRSILARVFDKFLYIFRKQ